MANMPFCGHKRNRWQRPVDLRSQRPPVRTRALPCGGHGEQKYERPPGALTYIKGPLSPGSSYGALRSLLAAALSRCPLLRVRVVIASKISGVGAPPVIAIIDVHGLDITAGLEPVDAARIFVEELAEAV